MGSEVIIVPAAFLTVAYVFNVVANAFARRQQLRASIEFQGKLLDRVGSMREFGEFLNTEGGQRFLSSLASETGGLPHLRVLRSLQAGIVLLFVGIGIFFYVGQVDLRYGAYENIAFVGTISTATGLGLLLSGALSYRLSRRMGLINGHRSTAAESVTSSV